MNKEILYGIVVPALTRHAVGAIGALGVTGDNVETQVAGTLSLGVAIGWSMFAKMRARRAKNGAK